MNLTGIPFDGLFKLVDSLFTTEDERAKAKLSVLELASAGDLAQLEVNKMEAANPSLFVSGWRPFIGWTCGIAFAYAFVCSPILETLVYYAYTLLGAEVDLSGAPSLDLGEMMPVLLGMLGLGGLRTAEKYKGVERS